MVTVKRNLPDEEAEALEGVAAEGGFASSSALVRATMEDLIAGPIGSRSRGPRRDVALREAANAAGGADTIGFDATVFNGEAADILRLTQGQIAITDELTIDGGAGVTITGDANGDDVTLAGGSPTSSPASKARIASTTTAASSTPPPTSPSMA